MGPATFFFSRARSEVAGGVRRGLRVVLSWVCLVSRFVFSSRFAAFVLELGYYFDSRVGLAPAGPVCLHFPRPAHSLFRCATRLRFEGTRTYNWS